MGQSPADSSDRIGLLLSWIDPTNLVVQMLLVFNFNLVRFALIFSHTHSTYTHTHTRTHARTHAHTHTRTHTRAHTPTHMHTPHMHNLHKDTPQRHPQTHTPRIVEKAIQMKCKTQTKYSTMIGMFI
jgi:hypothetical protein